MITMPSKEELIEKLKKCGKNIDPESEHIDADEILLKIIDDKEVTKVWNKISRNFWYA